MCPSYALPIQEDETALVLWALWKHHEISGSPELARPLFDRLIRPASRFMLTYRHEETGLPLESYDLWEERYGRLHVHDGGCVRWARSRRTICPAVQGCRAREAVP